MNRTIKMAFGLNVAAALSVAPGVALAQSVGDIADGLTGQITNVNNVITITAFVIGVALAIMGLLKFHANSKNPNDPSNKMSTAFILIFVGAALVAIPAVLGSGIQTIWGGGADTTDATTGFTSLN